MKGNKESKILKVMELAVKFIGTLNEYELDELINKECKFEIKSKKKLNTKSKAISKVEEDEFISMARIINKSSDREEAKRYIESLKLTKDKLIILGEKLGIKISKGTKKDKIIDILIEDTVGNRLKVEGLRKGIMGGKC